MKLHTKEQAPKEGKAERPPEQRPMPQARRGACCRARARPARRRAAAPAAAARRAARADVVARWPGAAPAARPPAPRAAHAARCRAAAPQWKPTKEGYLSFLIESKAVYDCMESIMATGDNPICAPVVAHAVLSALAGR